MQHKGLRSAQASGFQNHYTLCPSSLDGRQGLAGGTTMLDGPLDKAPSSSAPTIAVYARTAMKRVPRAIVLRAMPSAASVAAHELFSVLREFDAKGVKLIWVETPHDTLDWEGVRDRACSAPQRPRISRQCALHSLKTANRIKSGRARPHPAPAASLLPRTFKRNTLE